MASDFRGHLGGWQSRVGETASLRPTNEEDSEMPTVGPSNAPNNPKNPTSRGQVLGTNAVDFIDLNAITSTATLPYNARGNGLRR